MTLNMLINKNLRIVILIIAISLYHYSIQNVLEKRASNIYLPYNIVRRPIKSCQTRRATKKVTCIGFPSAHSEVATIFCMLAHYYNLIPLWFALLIIFIVSIQRLLCGAHTIIQIISGIVIGYTYANIYEFTNLNWKSFFLVFMIGLYLHKITNLSSYMFL